MNSDSLISLTLALMNHANVPVRDTFEAGQSFDLQWSDTELRPSAKSLKIIEVPGRRSIGYEGFRITVPRRYLNSQRLDPAVHECVHFLQHQTLAEERAYFSADPADKARHLQYLCQRVEVEAHFVQLLYIFRDQAGYLQSIVDPKTESDLNLQLHACLSRHAMHRSRQEFIIQCKGLSIL